jgi:hypothetical protein
MTMRQAELRGGPPGAVRKGGLSWCVRDAGRVGIGFRKGKAALIATSSPTLTGAGTLVPGRKARLARGTRRLGGGLVIKRGKTVSRVALVRAGKVRWSGIAAGRPSARTLKALAKGAGV